MRNRILLLATALGCLAVSLGCTLDSKTSSSAPPPSTTQPYVATVTTLVTMDTNETSEPADLDSLNLTGLDTDTDEHAFDQLLGIN